MEKIAIIDLGSNSVRMDIIAIPGGKAYRYLARRRRLVRLSEGMGTERTLKPVPVRRTISALADFAKELEEAGAERVIAIATAAVRRAENGGAFCAEVLQKTGIRIQVISGGEEAQYDLLGVRASLDLDDGVLVDTGGGSTEIIGVKEGKMAGKVSLPLGAVTLTEQFFGAGETPHALRLAEEYCREAVFLPDFLEECRGLPLVGLGGSVAAAALADIRLRRGNGELHGYTMSLSRLEEIKAQIFAVPADRRNGLGIEPGRERTAVCGLLPGLMAGERIGAPSITICTAGLREGVLYAHLETLDR